MHGFLALTNQAMGVKVLGAGDVSLLGRKPAVGTGPAAADLGLAPGRTFGPGLVIGVASTVIWYLHPHVWAVARAVEGGGGMYR